MVVVVMVVLVVVLGLAAVITTALTASYSSLARRVDNLEENGVPSVPIALSGQPTAVATGVGGDVGRASADIVGVTLGNDPTLVAVRDVSHHSLLAFLSSGCSTCGRFWSRLASGEDPGLPADIRLIVLTKGPELESQTALSPLARGVDVVMSTQAWADYEVPGTPFFIFVDGASNTVRGEGTALGWDEVRNLIALGRSDASIVSGISTRSRKPASDADREATVDQILMEASIYPGDRSLYPSSEPQDHGSSEST